MYFFAHAKTVSISTSAAKPATPIYYHAVVAARRGYCVVLLCVHFYLTYFLTFSVDLAIADVI